MNAREHPHDQPENHQAASLMNAGTPAAKIEVGWYVGGRAGVGVASLKPAMLPGTVRAGAGGGAGGILPGICASTRSAIASLSRTWAPAPARPPVPVESLVRIEAVARRGRTTAHEQPAADRQPAAGETRPAGAGARRGRARPWAPPRPHPRAPQRPGAWADAHSRPRWAEVLVASDRLVAATDAAPRPSALQTATRS